MAIDYPNNREVVNVYAEHMIALGDHDQALELLRRHLDNEATMAEDYIYLLQLERYLGREELVAEDHRRALERFSEDESILTYTAYLHLERGDYKGAIAMYREGLKRATTDEKRSELWGNIGDVYHEMENDKAAFKAYRKALDYNANNILVLNNYAYFLSLKNQELERALEMSYRAMSGEPGNAAYVDTYAWILHLLGRNDEAKTYMRQALTISSQRDASLLCHYGDILWALGEKFMAETYWKKAIERGYDSREMEAHIAEIKANTKQ
jgi:tetratricopeptide (TPR) repeat protein